MILFGALKLFMALLDPSWLLLGPIWSQNGPENCPRNYPKVVPKMVQKTAPPKIYSKTILGSNLGQFWGQMAPKNQQCKLAGTIRPAYGTPKTLKNQWFFKVFATAAFWVFEALNGPLGPILAPSWPDLVPKRSRNWPPKLPKSGPKNGPKNCPQKVEF